MGSRDHEPYVSTRYFEIIPLPRRQLRDGKRVKVTSLGWNQDSHRFLIEKKGRRVVITEQEKDYRIGIPLAKWKTIGSESFSIEQISRWQDYEMWTRWRRKKVRVSARRRG